MRAIALGCAALGTGGGGDVRAAILETTVALNHNGPVEVVSLDQLPHEGLILPMSSIGAPTAALELLGSGNEPIALRAEVERVTGKEVVAVMAAEIGGSNGVAPIGWAARLGLPIVDADGMGRAFPELQMISMNAAGLVPGTVFLVDVLGNVASLRTIDPEWAERWARALCVASGDTATMVDYLMTVRQARGAVVEGTVSLAYELGSIILTSAAPLDDLQQTLRARRLISGRITDIDRSTVDGFVRGIVHIAGSGNDDGRTLSIRLQNENLVADEAGTVIAGVPDLITIFDSTTAQPIATESIRFGQRVSVLAWPCAPIWRTRRGLELAGPSAFGLTHPYQPIEDSHE